MFFFEKIVEYIRKNKFDEVLENYDEQNAQNPLFQIPLEDEIQTAPENIKCDHLFMPIDSTGEVLACSKCGELRKKSELTPTNFFLKKDA